MAKKSITDDLAAKGYTIVEHVLSDRKCEVLKGSLPALDTAGSRILLSLKRFKDLAKDLRSNASLATYLSELVAVECVFFNKTRDQNWAVTLHRDTVLPAMGRGEWSSAGTKEGMDCVKPTRQFMDQCLAVRVHLDGASKEDISVVPGSHLTEQQYERSEAIPIAVKKGAALVLHPTLAHASSKLHDGSNRRVLHYVFAPKQLPVGYDWYNAD